MSRVAPTLLVLALLAATAAAFVRAERLKLEKSPILAPSIDDVFSPRCECSEPFAHIAFTLRHGTRVSVSVIDGDGDLVRTLARNRRVPTRRVSLTWSGRDSRERLAPDGTYRLRLDLGARIVVPPNRIVLDTRAPRTRIDRVSRSVFSPDGDARFDTVQVHYTANERVRAVLYVDGRRFERKKLRDQGGTFRWNGRLGGRTVPDGTYALSVVARDDAGNLSAPARVRIRVRYIELARAVLRAKAGTRIGVRVRTDARSFTWRLGPARGTARPGLLVVRAPQPGRYVLVVEASGHVSRARVIVTPRPVPAVTP